MGLERYSLVSFLYTTRYMVYLLNTFYSLFPHVSYLGGIPQIFCIFLSIYSVVMSGSDAANLLMMTLMLEDMLLFLKLNFFYVVQEMYSF